MKEKMMRKGDRITLFEIASVNFESSKTDLSPLSFNFVNFQRTTSSLQSYFPY